MCKVSYIVCNVMRHVSRTKRIPDIENELSAITYRVSRAYHVSHIMRHA